MTVGLGITTYNRPAHLKVCYNSALSTAPNDLMIHISDDSLNRRGIAFRKNECIKNLNGADYIFLVDDDVVFLKPGWAEFFINAHKASGNHHFLYLKDTPNIRLQKTEGDIEVYNNCGGAFMFLTKEVIEKVGGFNPAYKTYGMEHAGYTRRVHMAGLNPSGMYLSVKGAGEYIYAMDYDFHLPFNKQLKHEPSMKDEIGKLNQYVMENKPVYDNDLTIYQPL